MNHSQSNFLLGKFSRSFGNTSIIFRKYPNSLYLFACYSKKWIRWILWKSYCYNRSWVWPHSTEVNDKL